MTRSIEEVFEHVEALRIEHELRSYTSLYISRAHADAPWSVMVRQHDLAGCDYSYIFPLSEDEARAIIKANILKPWFFYEKLFSE